MALGATVYNFKIELADSDRGVYAPLDLRVARHPSETEDHLLTRVLAYCLEYTEGISLSNGLSDPDQPAISVRDLTGVLRVWIDVGAPEAARLHRAAKLAPRFTPTKMPSSSPPASPRRKFTAPRPWNCMPWIGSGWQR
jgi:uncharacterized protein YaeQ